MDALRAPPAEAAATLLLLLAAVEAEAAAPPPTIATSGPVSNKFLSASSLQPAPAIAIVSHDRPRIQETSSRSPQRLDTSLSHGSPPRMNPDPCPAVEPERRPGAHTGRVSGGTHSSGFEAQARPIHSSKSGLTGNPIASAANSLFSAVAMRCGSLHLDIQASPSRGRVSRTMTLIEAEWGEEVAFMACNEGCWDLLLCTSHGNVYIWDLEDEPKCTLEENLLSYPYLLSSVGVAGVTLSDTGEPVIAFEDGLRCVFRSKLKCWVRVANCT